jgi:hypothetical protein
MRLPGRWETVPICEEFMSDGLLCAEVAVNDGEVPATQTKRCARHLGALR